MGTDLDPMLSHLTRFALELEYQDIPDYAVSAIKDRLVDTLGCAIGAMDCTTATIGLALAGPPARPELAGRVIGSADRPAAHAAAFVNGCRIRELDFNDTYPGGHPSDSLAGLFAIAPVAGASGEELITAAAIAYEVFIRLQMSGRLREKGWDNGFGIGVGVAAALGRLLDLDEKRLRNAIALTATSNVPMRATRAGMLSMWKGAATAFAVQTAVLATQLAAAGMDGPTAPFTGRHGLADLITGPLEIIPFGTQGGQYYVPRAWIKYWPVAYNQQLLVWAGKELRDRLRGRELASAHVVTNWSAWHESGSEPEKWDPQTKETADHSMPYILAWTLRHGGIGPEAFVPASYLDLSLRPTMNKITVSDDEELTAQYPEKLTMRLDAIDERGEAYHIEIVNPIGHDDRPLSREDLEAKFGRLVGPVIGDPRTRVALDAWWSIEEHSIDEALDLLIVGDG